MRGKRVIGLGTSSVGYVIENASHSPTTVAKRTPKTPMFGASLHLATAIGVHCVARKKRRVWGRLWRFR